MEGIRELQQKHCFNKTERFRLDHPVLLCEDVVIYIYICLYIGKVGMILNKKIKNIYLEKIGLHLSDIDIYLGARKNTHNTLLEKYYEYIYAISLSQTTDITKYIELSKFSRLNTINYYVTIDRHIEIYLEKNLPKLKNSGIRNIGLILDCRSYMGFRSKVYNLQGLVKYTAEYDILLRDSSNSYCISLRESPQYSPYGKSMNQYNFSILISYFNSAGFDLSYFYDIGEVIGDPKTIEILTENNPIYLDYLYKVLIPTLRESYISVKVTILGYLNLDIDYDLEKTCIVWGDLDGHGESMFIENLESREKNDKNLETVTDYLALADMYGIGGIDYVEEDILDQRDQFIEYLQSNQ